MGPYGKENFTHQRDGVYRRATSSCPLEGAEDINHGVSDAVLRSGGTNWCYDPGLNNIAKTIMFSESWILSDWRAGSRVTLSGSKSAAASSR